MKQNWYRHPKKTCLIIVVLMLIGAWILPFILQMADCIVETVECIECFEENPLRLGKDVWFSFYGSFLGVIATVILGFITLRFSANLERIHKEESYFKLNISEIKFYDLYRDFHPSLYREASQDKRFLISLQMDAFEPSYEIRLESMEWGKDENTLKKVKDVEMQILQQEKTILKFYFDDIKSDDKDSSSEESFNYYYRLFAYEPLIKEFNERQRCLKLQFSVKTKRNTKDKENDIIELSLSVENMGYKSDGMSLGLCNTRMKLAEFT